MTSPILAKSTLNFLNQLQSNNNKAWFQSHKPDFETAKTDFTNFITAIAEEVALFDSQVEAALPDPQTIKIFRIYRDVRFSKDKTPYKTNFGGVIVPYGMKSGNAGYYFHLQPDQSFAGGGIHMPDPKILNHIRHSIDQDATQLESIIAHPDFKTTFNNLDTNNSLKTIPRGYPKDHPNAHLLKLKSYTAGKDFSDKQVLSQTFFQTLTQTYQTLHPLIDYLNKTLKA